MEASGVYITGANGELFPYDLRAKLIGSTLKHGDRVMVRVRKARHPEHSSLAHLVFRKIGDGTGTPEENIKLWLKWETGRCDVVMFPNGKRFANPRSVAFENMDQIEFQSWWDDCLVVINEQVMHKLPEEVYEEVRRMIIGKAVAA